MKFLHLADLHLGKRVNGFSMIEDQKYILNQILTIASEQHPDAVLIAGDVYDRPIPSEEAVSLFDVFLVQLSELGTEVFVISGNHDSAERVAFGGRLMDAKGIHFAPIYNGNIQPIPVTDAHGAVNLWLIPYLKPGNVRRFYPDAAIETYTEAMQFVIDSLSLDTEQRNVAVVHQFLVGGSRCDSEECSVGGLDEIDASIFDSFDYVALGHLHGPQQIVRPTVRYAGSPLKYSFSEVHQKKSVTVVELDEKGDCCIDTIPLTPLRDLKQRAGTFAEIMAGEETAQDYYDITLTDEEDIPNALSRLRARYPYLMGLRYDNTRTRTESTILGSEEMDTKSPLTLFSELYALQNGQEMNTSQQEYVESLIEEIWGEML